jgi:hypothetical protein
VIPSRVSLKRQATASRCSERSASLTESGGLFSPGSGSYPFAAFAVDTAAGVLHPPGRIHNHNHPERTRGFAPPARLPVTAAGRSPCAIPSTGRAKRGQALTIPVADADAYHESPAKATVKVVFAFTVKETTSLPLELTVPRSIIFLALPLGCA